MPQRAACLTLFTCSSAHLQRTEAHSGPKYVAQPYLHGSTLGYTAYTARSTGGNTLSLTLGVDNETAALAWLIGALEQARARSQTKLVGYLEVILEDVVFEMESAARSRRKRISSSTRLGPSRR